MLNKSGAKSYQMDMCTGSILKKMLIFSLPLMASSMLQLLFNAADIIVVGRFAGDNALAAVGSNTALINLLTNFFMGLSIGANVLVARYFGAKNDKDLSETVHTAMMLSIYNNRCLMCKTDSHMDADTRGCTRTCNGIFKNIFPWYDSYDDIQFRQCYT